MWQGGTGGHSGETGDDNSFTYDAQGVDTPDVIRVVNATPFRRLIFSALADRPKIVAASVGDSCRISVRGGTMKLEEVKEQYIVDACPPTP